MANTSLTQEEIETLMSRNSDLNFKKLTSEDFLEYLGGLSDKYLKDLKKELSKYLNKDIEINKIVHTIGKPNNTVSIVEISFIHIELKDRFKDDLIEHLYIPKELLHKMHVIKNPNDAQDGGFDLDKVIGKVNTSINKCFSAYGDIEELPLFQVVNHDEINEFELHLREETYQELVFEITIDENTYKMSQLVSVAFFQKILDIYENGTQEASSTKQQAYENFEKFTDSTSFQENNIDFLHSIPLELSVVLGKTKKTVKEVLRFNVGQVIELNRMVDAPLDICVNDQIVARGEVVVVDDNFGIKIIEIINVKKEDLF